MDGRDSLAANLPPSDVAFLVIDEPAKLALNSLWGLPVGVLADLPDAHFLDTLSQSELRALPLVQVGFHTDLPTLMAPTGLGTGAGSATPGSAQSPHSTRLPWIGAS